MAFVTHHNLTGHPRKKEKIEGVDFSSERAGEVAMELGFTSKSLEGMTGSGRDGAITVRDLRSWVKED